MTAFLENYWYVAANAGEVGVKPLGRRICGQALVLFRKADGSPVALEDKCPHRLVALSLGQVVGDEIECGYHGVRFNAAGRCTLIPSQSEIAIPKGLDIRSYRAHEAFGLVFVWIGDAALADPALIPGWYGYNTREAWRTVYGYTHVRGHYQLLVDNLLDLTHVNFTHRTTLASPGLAEVVPDVRLDGDRVEITRTMRNVPPSVRLGAIKGTTGNVDRFLKSEFALPSYILVSFDFQPTGAVAQMNEPTQTVLNAITPETETSTHYFWSVGRNYRLDDAELDRALYELNRAAFDEDAAMIGSQQAKIDELPAGVPLLNFRGDHAAAAARRIVRRKLAEGGGDSARA